jgi:outer membrane protein
VTLPAPDKTPPAVVNRPLTADEAARIALHFQPTIGIARGNVASAHGRTTQVRAGLYPQVVAGTGYDNLQSLSGYGILPTQSPTGFLLPTASPVDPFTAELQIKQLIYDFNLTRNLVRQSKAFEEVALSNLDQAQSDLVFSVKSSYYAYEFSERLVDVNQQNLDNRQRQLDLAQSRIKNGIGLPSDVVTAETSKSQAILALNLARDNAEQAKVSLLTKMGIDPLTPIALVPSEEPLYDIDSPKPLLQTAMLKRPEIRAAEQAVVASKYGVKAARAVDLPTIFAGLGAGTRGLDSTLNDNTVSFQVGIQIPIYDGGTRSGAIQFSKGQLSSAVSQLLVIVQTVQNDVAAAYLSLKSAEQRVTIAENEVANASEGVRIAEGRYRSGLGLFLDITTAQSLLLTALTDQNLAHQALSQARTKVRFATGETLELAKRESMTAPR